MEYISHEDYKNLMSQFQKGTTKGKLTEGVKEGNAFTAALAKTKKGDVAKVDGKKIKDTSNYDDPSVKEYSYTDNYAGSWGYREGQESDDYSVPSNAQSGDTDAMNIAEEGEGSFGQPEILSDLGGGTLKIKNPEGKVVDVDFEFHAEEQIDPYTVTGWAQGEDGQYVYTISATKVQGSPMDFEHETLEVEPTKEGLKPAPMQATGPTIQTVENSISNPPMGFQVLSPDEREQLREYIKTVKTVKQEIKKLVAKAKGPMNENMGGDRTGLVMTPSTTYEDKAGQEMAGDPEKEAEMKASLVKREGHSDEIENIESKISSKLYGITEKVIEELMKAGLTPGEIQMWINHEIEEKGKEAIMSQHDPY